MKLIKITFIIWLVLMGCQKFEEYKANEPANFNSEEKITEAITGAYDCFRNIFINHIVDESNGDDQLAWYMQPNSRSDEYSHCITNYAYYEMTDGQIQYNCSYQTTLLPLFRYDEKNGEWFDFYKTITTLNTILVHAENQGNLSKEVKKILGEAYFLRGYVYFRLVRIYGRVPLIKDNTVDYTVPKATFEEIYTSIINDINKAIELLPENGASARISYTTPHKGTAKAVLAEVYLSGAGYPLKKTEYYTKAAEIAGNIMDSSSFYGYEILPDFGDLWKNQHQYNKEIVMGIDYNINGYGLSRRMSANSVDSNTFIYSINLAGNSNYGAGIRFFNHFPNSYRKAVTFFSLLLKPYNMDSLDNGILTPFERDSMDLCTPFYFNKFNSTWHLDSNSIIDNNARWPEKNYFDSYYDKPDIFELYIYRYAQTLLTYAEAKARSGQLDGKAYEALNIIRRRANKADLYSPSSYDITPNLSPEQFADSVVWERAWELCAEPEGRWFDLIRLEKVEDLPKLRDVNDMEDYPSVINKDYYFLPIPETEIYFNPNLI